MEKTADYNEEVGNLQSSPNIITVIKKRRAGNVACMKYGIDEKCVKKISQETLEDKTTWQTQARMGG
jgi:hypothetical protein